MKKTTVKDIENHLIELEVINHTIHIAISKLFRSYNKEFTLVWAALILQLSFIFVLALIVILN